MVAAVARSFLTATHRLTSFQENRRHLRGSLMRGLGILLSASALLGTLAIAPAARAQVVIDIGVPPVCSYGYYDYAPYACAPVGFYGPGYFYNGIFLGMGLWAGWGYSHGWGSHRFSRSGGGTYNGGGGYVAARGGASDRSGARGKGRSDRPSAATSRATGPRGGTSARATNAPAHNAAPHGGASQAKSRPAAAHAQASAPRGGGARAGSSHGSGHDNK